MKYTPLFLMFLSAFALSSNIQARAEALKQTSPPKPIAVLEIFTSQHCSAAPEADRLFTKIMGEEQDYKGEIIGFSCHKLLSNIQEQESKFPNALCTTRHMAYVNAKIIEGTSTPRAIINGRFATRGGDAGIVTSGVKMAHSFNNIKPLALKLQDDNLEIQLPKTTFYAPVTLWLFAYDRAYNTKLRRKETLRNFFKKDVELHYTNSVSHIQKLPLWDGHEQKMIYPITDYPADGYAVLAQYDDFSAILAAGKVERPLIPMTVMPSK